MSPEEFIRTHINEPKFLEFVIKFLANSPEWAKFQADYEAEYKVLRIAEIDDQILKLEEEKQGLETKP